VSAQPAIAEAPPDEARHDLMAPARAELEAALDRVAAAYLALAPEIRAGIDLQDRELEAAVDAALQGDDPIRASAAIRAWEAHWIDRLDYLPVDRADELVTQIVNHDWDAPIPPRRCR